MKYIAYYDEPENSYQQRSVNLAAANVIEYIADSLNRIEPLEILSPSRSLAKKGVFKASKIKLLNGTTLRLPFTFGVTTRIGRLFSISLTQLWLLYQLVFHCKKNDTIVVYHSISLIPIVKLIRKFKPITLVLEIREIYSDINSNISNKKEIDYFKIADGYVFATQLLNDKINTCSKPYVIAPGIYRSEIIDEVKRWDDGKIHLVYAGNFRKAKGGAETSVRIAEYLSDKYVIHILGGGDKESIDYIIKLIDAQNSKHGALVVYEGVKSGNDFNYFLQKCDIGLSTQNPEGKFNDSSFPSKILTYLANGLEVLSADIPAVSTSPVGDLIHYYHSYDPKSIAKAIMDISVSKNSKEALNLLDEQLKSKLYKLLKEDI